MTLRRLVLGLVASTMLAACELPGLPFGGPAGPQPPPEDRRLAAADAMVYAGDYDGGERAYQDLIKAGVPDAGAHYSTLLAYESRLDEAVSEARTAVARRADSDSLGRLCRALDWAEDVPDALRAGAQAVRADPVQPLAHVYYAEALADARELPQAEQQLRAVQDADDDPYVVSEAYRVSAVVATYQRDDQAQLNYLTLALKEQPAFPQRMLELATYDLQHGRQQLGEQLIDQVQSAHPRSYAMLVEAANSAFAAADLQHALLLYRSAHQIRPAGGDAALGAAEIAIVVQHDVKGAHDLLLSTLRAATSEAPGPAAAGPSPPAASASTAAVSTLPASAAVYEYLRELDLLLLKTDPEADLKAVARPAALDRGRAAVLASVNAARKPLELAPVAENSSLADAALAHAYYYLFNLSDPTLSGAGIHNESSGDLGFTGVSGLDRDRHFGFAGAGAQEVTGHLLTSTANVGQWLESVHQRYPLLSSEASTVGYGEARVGLLGISVLEVGLEPPGHGDPVVYPAPNQSGVPPVFPGETPSPLPSGAETPAGFPVTLTVGGARRLSVTSGRLLGPDGKAVSAYSIAPGQGGDTTSQWALIAEAPLQTGARYTAEVSGAVDGAPFSRRWSFTVATD